MKIPIGKPHLTSRSLRAIKKALSTGWVSVGPYNEMFEKAFEELTGLSNCVSVNSGTSALFIALKMMSPQKGEVIVPSFTFPATINAVINAGFKPRIIDVEYESMNISTNLIRESIQQDTVGILPVHFSGKPCDMASIKHLAQFHSLFIVEDCAHGLGTWCSDGQHVGGSSAGCFSFFATKGITTGEGGMVAFADVHTANKAKLFALHGVWPQQQFEDNLPARRSLDVGHNMRLAGILAALGLSQIKDFSTMQRKRSKIAAKYNRAFASEEELIPPDVSKKEIHSWHLYILRTRQPDLRDFLFQYLRQKNISASIHYRPALHQHDIYSRYRQKNERYHNTERLVKTVLTLPCYPDMRQTALNLVIGEVKNGIRLWKSSQ